MTHGSSRLPPGAPVAAPVSPAALTLVTTGFAECLRPGVRLNR
jgi:hypothetical protein